MYRSLAEAVGWPPNVIGEHTYGQMYMFMSRQRGLRTGRNTVTVKSMAAAKALVAKLKRERRERGEE